MTQGIDSRPVDRGTSSRAASVLLVEDNPVVQQVTTEMLHAIGCETDLAPDGPAALEAAVKKDYDMILMDCQLPGLDGLEVTRRIRSSGEGSRRRVPIVALAGVAGAADRAAYAAAGMDDCLAKPFRLQQLEQTVDRWVPRHADRGVRTGAQASGVSEPAAAADSTTPVLDPRIVATIQALSSDGGFFSELVAVFTNSFASTLPGLREAIATGDAKAASRAAHSLKSTSNNLGARPLAALCAQLEALGRARQMEGAPEILAAIDAEYVRARAALLAESA